MVRKRIRGRVREENGEASVHEGGKGDSSSGYQKFRDQRIKENKERMQKLGIFDLSLKLKARPDRPKGTSRNASAEKKTLDPSPVSGLARRSSRIKNLAPVRYVEIRKKKIKSPTGVEICIPEGTQPEIYTEEHEKLLGDCKNSWTLFVDGYGKDGKRIYDPLTGETCHQCRQKTLGRRTYCSKCNLIQGQFCGDCLYMRYGENLIEAKENPNWICPVCRGICNCSLCRKAKGWGPTGTLYRKIENLGFKSVAHYLIQTRRFQTNSEDPEAENSIASDKSVEKTSYELMEPQCEEDKEKKVEDEGKKVHCSDSKHYGIKGEFKDSGDDGIDNMNIFEEQKEQITEQDVQNSEV